MELQNNDGEEWLPSPAESFDARYIPHYKTACDVINTPPNRLTVVQVVYP